MVASTAGGPGSVSQVPERGRRAGRAGRPRQPPGTEAWEQALVGIDENGLGPRLGPLVVTAVWARTTEAGATRATRRPRGGMRDRLGDSKGLVSHGDVALAEAWARAIAARTARERAGHAGGPGAAPIETPDALLRALSLDGDEVLRAPCPREHEAQCWTTAGEAFQAGADLVAEVERDLARLERGGVDVRRARCVVACTRRLNEAVGRGLSRFDVDLHSMERLALDAREQAGRDVVALCGKVGGYDRYSAAFGPTSGRLHAVVCEGRARSEYAFPGLGRIAFVRDADDRHLIVSMASLVGKWVRELLMARIVRHHRAVAAGGAGSGGAELPDASGYHDPVTARFVEATRLTRRSTGLPDDCFERRAISAPR
jgi:ribonuclease HII